MLYRNSLPEVNSSIKQSAKYLASPDAPKPILKRLLLLMTLVIIAAVTIGVGVGVWHTRRKGSSGVRYDLLLGLHCDSLSFLVYRFPVRRVPTYQQDVHLPIRPLHSTSSMTRHWQL